MRSYILFSYLILFGIGCSSDNATGPKYVKGTYVFDLILEGSTPAHLLEPQPPFALWGTVVDSIKDTLFLYSDLTYRESGVAWRISLLDPYNEIYPIRANGTYVIDGSSVILYPEYGATVGGGLSNVDSQSLMLERYPGLWKFTK